jgi:hypothetical protein
MKLFFLVLVLVGLAIAGFAIKMFFIKGGQFSKSCSSVETDSNGKRVGCTCSASGGNDTQCENYEKHHGKSA